MTELDAGRPVTISVVICAYTEDRWDDLVAGIRSVQHQASETPEVVVVIDHNEALYDRVRRAISGVTVTTNTDRRGLSGARNCGVAAATGDVVAFLDDDAMAEPGWLARLVETYRDDDVIGVGGSVTPRWDEARPRWFPPEFNWVVGCSYHGMPERTAPIRNFIGTNMSFRRDALVAYGGFNLELGRVGSDASGCEETELCIRVARESGGHLIYEPSALVTHRVPASRATWSYFSRRCYQEGRSKATVARLAGSDQALATERTYLLGVIPRRVVKCLTPRDHEAGGPSMAAAVVVGVVATVIGFLAATVAPHSSRARVRPGAWRGWLGLSMVAAMWGSTFLWSIQINHMDDFGLVTIMPVMYWVTIGLLTVSFWWWVRWRRAGPVLLAAHVILLIAILHATPAILEQTVRYPWAYKHIGITDYIVTHHGVDNSLNKLMAYQDWPGYFGLNALFVSGSGVSSALSYAQWAPPVNELLLLAPLTLIFRTFTANRTVVWTAVWLFYLGNWVGQDYFSPQAFAFLLYLTAIAVVLRWFIRLPATARVLRTSAGLQRPKAAELAMSGGRVVEQSDRRPAPAMYAAVVMIAAAIAMSHQLTPLMLIAALGGLLVTRRLRARSLFVVVTVVSIGWIVTWAMPFLHQQLPGLIRTLGHPFDNASTAVAQATSPSHGLVISSQFDEALSAVIVCLALLGAWRAWRSARWRRWQPAACLTVTPILAFFTTNYGNEAMFRVFLFSLPFLALFAGSALAPRPTGTSLQRAVRWTVGLAVISTLTVSFFFAYDGKEKLVYMPASEVAAIKRLDAIAPAGSLITMAVNNMPWGFEHYTDYHYEGFLGDTSRSAKAFTRNPVRSLFELMLPYPHAYVVFAPTDEAEIELNGILPPGEYKAIERAVLASPEFTKVISEGGVTIATLRITQ